MSQRLVHLVYIHGFRGDETTFQTFPTHIQQYLTDHLPSHLDFKVYSSLYPTYRSIKPISFATKNFIEWLRTQPPGPVILLAHSMGGLLAAEAATELSITDNGHKRIVGLVAFDCPYLGMHPHVVVTGIASLLPKRTDAKIKTEAELNPSPDVQIIDRNEGIENHEGIGHSSSSSPSRSSTPSSPPSVHHHSKSDSFIDRTKKFIKSYPNDPLVRWVQKHSNDPVSTGKRWVVEHFQFGSCMFDPAGLKDRYTTLVSAKGLFWVNYWTVTSPHERKVASHMKSEGEIDHRQVLDDDSEALDRAGNLKAFDKAHNTDAHKGSSTSNIAIPLDDSREELSTLLESQFYSMVNATENNSHGQQTQNTVQKHHHSAGSKESTLSKEKEKGGRHFVVLPTGLGTLLGGGDRWEQVVIGGVDDEVAAHCGLFIPEQNLEYAKLVERVGNRIIEWCNKV
ncbi:hypothetical protein F5878DRAFT_303818 [Lentinula raphanica]|uniref:AB hydrolase-1 domain-containing protein n=1 Tax=Lentinula raphanica TaxID=153919 RepID=A0AA38P3K7_9AGAR|nr:hypothetical protein F5878DRAFT_303818 [Lentinula raphanica]